jgi:hypothetical protein
MAKKEQTKSVLPDGYVALRPARSAGYFVYQPGNKIEGTFRESVELDDPNKPGAKRVLHKIEVGVGDQTTIKDAETAKERLADEGDVIGIDEKGYTRSLREVQKGQQVAVICVRLQDKKEAKKGRNPAWICEVGVVPF